MANYYQSYYHSKDNGKPGNIIKAYGRDVARSDYNITDKQKKYHSDLFNFLKDRGILKDDLFARPKSAKDCSRKIHALYTILCKSGLKEEFFGNKEEEQ